MKKARKRLLWCVTGFGVKILFGLSRIFWFSLAMLFLTGVFDSVSMIVLHTLIQPLTRDEMRGRLSVVNNIFIGSSNELGAVESGLMAALFGPIIQSCRRIGNDPGALDKSIRATVMTVATSI
jgi:hypothetical protein